MEKEQKFTPMRVISMRRELERLLDEGKTGHLKIRLAELAECDYGYCMEHDELCIKCLAVKKQVIRHLFLNLPYTDFSAIMRQGKIYEEELHNALSGLLDNIPLEVHTYRTCPVYPSQCAFRCPVYP